MYLKGYKGLVKPNPCTHHYKPKPENWVDRSYQVAETCQLALQRLNWLKSQEEENDLLPNPYKSVDPAPSTSKMDVEDRSADN